MNQLTAFFIAVGVNFAIGILGYALGQKHRRGQIGTIIAVEDPVDHELYLSASFDRREDLDGLKDGDVVSFVVQRKVVHQ